MSLLRDIKFVSRDIIWMFAAWSFQPTTNSYDGRHKPDLLFSDHKQAWSIAF